MRKFVWPVVLWACLATAAAPNAEPAAQGTSGPPPSAPKRAEPAPKRAEPAPIPAEPAPKPVRPAPRPVQPAAKPPARARADADIEGDIRRRFARSKIHADQFTVKVSNGVAVIEGTTKVIQRKGVATRLARLGGARAVDNRIQIDEAARAAAAAKLQKSRADSDGHGTPRRRVQVTRSDSPN